MIFEKRIDTDTIRSGYHLVHKAEVKPVDSFLRFEEKDIEQSISARFEQQVCRFPDKVAVKTPRESMTYGQLNRTANQVARVILSVCKNSNEPICLLFGQGTLLIAAILATLKTGRIYVPLNPLRSDVQNREVLQDSTASHILTDPSLSDQANNLAEQDISVIIIDKLGDNLSTGNINLSISPDRLAYIFYTSGSTGKPKGVTDTHRNVLHNIMRYTNNLYISAIDRLTLLQPCDFSGSVSSLFCALLNGATCLPFDLEKEGTGNLSSWVCGENISIWHSVPSLFRLMANASYKFPLLRIIRLEGDQAKPLDLELYKKFFSDSCVLVNGLGATECGIVRQYFVNKKTPLPDSVVPVGYAVEDMEVLILDEANKHMEVNSIGEIAIRSRYLAPGYWRRPDLTETVFWNDPKEEGKRIYRTGDLGRMRDDGLLEYLGRKDFQQKLRGRWINIPKIEKTLHEMRTFKDVVVIARKGPSFDTRLIAYLSPKKDPIPKIDRIRQYLSKRLPDHMIPSVFVMMKSIPLNFFGKVDHKALPPPTLNRPEITEPYVAPQTLLQSQLKHIVENILVVRPVGIKDNLFDLGADSLIVIQLISRVRDTFHIELPLRILFDKPTVAELAMAITSNQGKKPGNE